MLDEKIVDLGVVFDVTLLAVEDKLREDSEVVAVVLEDETSEDLEDVAVVLEDETSEDLGVVMVVLEDERSEDSSAVFDVVPVALEDRLYKDFVVPDAVLELERVLDELCEDLELVLLVVWFATELEDAIGLVEVLKVVNEEELLCTDVVL